MAINSHGLHDDFSRDESSRKRKHVEISEETSETVSQQAENQESYHYQLRIWEDMKKRIRALIKKLNPSNIRDTSTELCSNNLLRGRGLLCRSIIKASLASPNSIPVLASLVAVINSELPDTGYLLLKRIIVQFSNAFEVGEKKKLSPLAKLLAQLINHRVVHGAVTTELLSGLLDEPSEVHVDAAVTFLLECGYCLQRVYPFVMDTAFERLAEIRESKKDKKSYCLIKGLFEIRCDRFLGFYEPKDGLDLVQVDDQIMHKISFLDNLDPEFSLDRFSFDSEFMEEEKYTGLAECFLGEVV